MTISHFYSIFLCALLMLSSSLASQNSLPSLYVGEITPRDKESQIYSAKIRNQIVISILNTQKGKYNILDDELVKQLSIKVAKLQKQGCDDTECRRALDLAIDWDEKIVGEIQKEGDRYSLVLKIYRMNKESYQPNIKSSIYKNFYSFQLDFYVREMSRSLIDSGYSPDFSLAPKKEGEEIQEKTEVSFFPDKTIWKNALFPGYNRITKDDSSGYILGSIWTASVLGILFTYPKYNNANSSNSTWATNTFLIPTLMPSGFEAIGGFYASAQMDSSYKEAYAQGQILNGFGLIAMGVWTYSWFYNAENKGNNSITRIPHTDWELDFQVKRQVDKGFTSMPESQYVLQFHRSLE
ncbi:MAG: hypothetical protein EBS19_13870 [Spirochaetia bacterium]|nr:hypothetical protein [Spirochaetia bacterium]